MKKASSWRLLRPWHAIPLLLTVLVLGGSLALRDPRPLLIAFWWVGVFAMMAAVALGVIGGIVVLIVGIRRQLVSGRSRESGSREG